MRQLSLTVVLARMRDRRDRLQATYIRMNPSDGSDRPHEFSGTNKHVAFGGQALAALTVTGPAIAGLVLPPPDLPFQDLTAMLEGECLDHLDQDAPGGPRLEFSVALYGDMLVLGGPGYLDASGRLRGRVFIYAWDDRRFRDRFEQ